MRWSPFGRRPREPLLKGDTNDVVTRNDSKTSVNSVYSLNNNDLQFKGLNVSRQPIDVHLKCKEYLNTTKLIIFL